MDFSTYTKSHIEAWGEQTRSRMETGFGRIVVYFPGAVPFSLMDYQASFGNVPEATFPRLPWCLVAMVSHVCAYVLEKLVQARYFTGFVRRAVFYLVCRMSNL